MITRTIYQYIQQDLAGTNKIVILQGARQVGKTTLMQMLTKPKEEQSLWINGDQILYHEYLSSRSLEKLKTLIGNHQLVVIDEAQNIPDIGINLKIIHDELPSVKLLISGSSSIELANSIQESLAGRTNTYHLFPISIEELVNHSSEFEVIRNLEQYLIYGLYPEVLTIESAANKRKHLREIVNSYLYKDILALSNIRKSDKIYKLLQLLAYQIGSLVSIHELSKSIGLNHETVNNYIDLLEKGFVIKRLSGYAANPRKEISKMDKIYFLDLGIRNALIDNFNSTDIRSDIGNIWENFIVMERIKYLSYHNQSGQLYFWRRYSGAEIDLVELRNGILNGIEIKWKKKSGKPPKSWIENYPNSTFKGINRDNFLEITKF